MGRLVTIIAAIALLGATAYAQNNTNYNDGYMMGRNHMQYDQMRDGHMNYNHPNNRNMMRDKSYLMQESLIKSSDDAKIRVETFIKDSGIKGYKIGRVETMTSNNNYIIYIVNSTDAAGNKMLFRVWPDGYVTGPSTELTTPRR